MAPAASTAAKLPWPQGEDNGKPACPDHVLYVMQSGGSPTGESIRAAALPPAAGTVTKLPWPQGKDKGSVRFAPRLEKVSEGQSTSSTEVDLADSPAASPPKRARPSRYQAFTL